MQTREWVSTAERLPSTKYAMEVHVDCFIFYKGDIQERPFNINNQCWDDKDYDDHCYDALEPSHWMFNEWPDKPEVDK